VTDVYFSPENISISGINNRG